MCKIAEEKDRAGKTTVETPEDAINEIAFEVKKGYTSGRLGPDQNGVYTHWELKTNSWKITNDLRS